MPGRLLVTGAASVIGQALLKRLRLEEEWSGAEFILSSTDPAKLPGSLRADFTNPAEVGELAARLLQKAPFDAAAFVAGLNMDESLARLPEETWDRVWDINVTAHARLLFALGQAGAFSFQAPVVFVSSIVGFRGNAGQSAYSAAKGALKDLCACAVNQGLRANLLLPPLVESPLLAGLSPEARRRLFDSRRMQDPDPAASCAEAASFLLSKRSSYINNHVFHADSRVTSLGLG